MTFFLYILFGVLLFIVFYSYVGYGIVLFVLVKLKRLFNPRPSIERSQDLNFMPEVTFMVAAYNEERWMEEKILNTLALDYPKDKIKFYFVTDGSNDGTMEVIDRMADLYRGYNIQLFHRDERKGKIAAVERVMEFVDTPIVIFTDANTDINPSAVKKIIRHYNDPKVGAVAGEKRIKQSEKDEASGAGEGIYWKYESLLKKWDSELNSVVGAAGELFSLRTELYEAVAPDTLIEDFYMTMRIAQKGYRVVYEPEASAAEGHSASIGEELKRKIRIAAGGLQAVWRLSPLLNIFKYGMLSFQYISHRVLRWTIAPIALPLLLVINIILALKCDHLFQFILLCQVLFYGMAIIGWLLETKKMKVKAFFVPYYFCIMNYAVYKGFIRLIKGQQSVVWEKAKRA
jgi:poly-beta-1,6-N-acetyl-D-glucosamine synthase